MRREDKEVDPTLPAGSERVRPVICPHCGGKMAIRLSLSVHSARKWETREDEHSWKEDFSKGDLAFLEMCKSNGVFAAYEQAVRRNWNIPKNMDRHFLGFFKLASVRRIPQFAINFAVREFPDKRIEFWAANDIGVFLADKQPVLFCPIETVKGRKVEGGLRVHASGDDFEAWTRTKLGYVPQGCREFYSMMNRRTIGEFANPVL